MSLVEQDTNNTGLTLTSADQVWLASYGVDPSWQTDVATTQELNDVMAIGSLRLDETLNHDRRDEIVNARIKFMDFVGIEKETLEDFQIGHPTIIPLDTFIQTQRVMAEFGLDLPEVINARPLAIGFAPESIREKVDNLTALGLNAAKVINTFPPTIGLAPDSVREKVDNLTALGLDAAKIINANPSTIGLAPESIREKLDNLTSLGLDAVKIINAHPTAIGLAPESVREKLDNLTSLGLDAVKIINASPSAIGFASESVREKVDNLTSLGLDAVMIINASPSAIGLAPESVRHKVRLLDRSIKVLKWQFSAADLINTFPVILSFNNQKLTILRRIAAKHISESDRSATPDVLKGPFILPLEKYIIQLSQSDQNSNMSVRDLYNLARTNKLDTPSRREKALNIAQSGALGRIGSMYFRYRDK